MAQLFRLVFCATIIVAVSSTACERKGATAGGDGDGNTDTGGASTHPLGDGGTTSLGGGKSGGATGGGPLNSPSGPLYHPPAGFEDCVHASVEENCSNGWCILPPSCFVMGSPEDEWHRGGLVREPNSSHLPPDDVQSPCLEDDCPASNITRWEAIEWTNSGNRIGSSDGETNPDDATGEHDERLTFVGQYDSVSMTHRTASLQGVAANGRANSIGLRLVRTLFEDSERSLAIVPP